MTKSKVLQDAMCYIERIELEMKRKNRQILNYKLFTEIITIID